LATGGRGGCRDASGEDVEEFLLFADATGGEGVGREESSVVVHEGGDAGFLGDAELVEERGVSVERSRGGVFSDKDAGSVEAENVGGAFASAVRKLEIAQHVEMHVRLAENSAKIGGWFGRLAGGAADDDDVLLDSRSPWVVLGGESDRTFDEVGGFLVSELERSDASDEFPVGVHEFSFDGVEMSFFVDSGSSESRQTEKIVFQSLILVRVLEVADQSEKILSSVLVADVLFEDDDGIDAHGGVDHFLAFADGHISSVDVFAGHAVGGSLQHDSSVLGLGHVSGNGGARFLEHPFLGVGVSLPFEDVVDADAHEGRRVDHAEGGAKRRRIGHEEGGASRVGGGRLDVGDLVEGFGVVGVVGASLGDFPRVGEILNILDILALGVGHVVHGFVIVRAEETSGLSKVPSGNGDGADFGLHVTSDGHSLLALDDDLIGAGSLDDGVGRFDGQFRVLLVDDRLEGVEDLDRLATGHHGDGVTFGSG